MRRLSHRIVRLLACLFVTTAPSLLPRGLALVLAGAVLLGVAAEEAPASPSSGAVDTSGARERRS